MLTPLRLLAALIVFGLFLLTIAGTYLLLVGRWIVTGERV